MTGVLSRRERRRPARARRAPRAPLPGRRVAALAIGLAALAWLQVSEAGDRGQTQRLLIRLSQPPVAAASAGPQRERAQADALVRLASRKSLRLRRIRESGDDWLVVALAEPVTADSAREIARRIADDPEVAHAEPDLRVFAQQANDPHLVAQWALAGPEQGSPGGTQALAAWGLADGAGVTVAVIDTGFTAHPDLDGAWLPGFDFIGADPDGSFRSANDGDGRDADASDPGDWCDEAGAATPSTWHGTAVAGLVAARAGNGYGIAGVAPAARILPVRAIGRCGGYMSDVIDAMRWAAGLPVAGVPANPHPARVLNLSLGSTPGTPCSPYQQRAVDEVVAAGTVVVAAAGNEGMGSVGVPANCIGVTAVAAHTRHGDLASYSNVGTNVALTAPGGVGSLPDLAVIASSNTGATAAALPDPARGFAGTSAAAPHVAGTAALLWSYDPRLSAVEIRNALAGSARPWPAGTHCSGALAGQCGAGMLDAGAALARVGSRVALDIEAPRGPLPGGTRVTLSALVRSMYAPDQLAYRWVQTIGPAVRLLHADAPVVALDLPPHRTEVGLRLAVTDPTGAVTVADGLVRVNNSPVATAVGSIIVAVGESVGLRLEAIDPDGDAVLFTLLAAPSGLSVGRSDGRLSWIAGDAGIYPVRVAIEDADGLGGGEIAFAIHVSDGSSLASPLRSAGAGRSGGGGSANPGLLALAGIAAALLCARRLRRWRARGHVTIGP